MTSVYNNHGLNSKNNFNFTQNSGRYNFQKKAEKLIPKDLATKLNLNLQDNCLEVGCNVGNVLIPLSKYVKSITGIDHPECIKILKKRNLRKNIKLIGNDFLKHKFIDRYDKIIIYSILQGLESNKQIEIFIDKSLKLLREKGKIIIGDIPNLSLKRRFLNSPEGKKFHHNWKKENSLTKKDMEFQKNVLIGTSLKHKIDDNLIIRIVEKLRKRNLSVYILPQNNNLPFGNTREDILIIKR